MPFSTAPLPPSDANQLHALAERLSRSWQAGEELDLRELIASAPESMRLRFLLELVQIDLGHRYQRNLSITLEDYLARYPELGPASELPIDVVYAEFRARHLYGDAPVSDSYQERFPVQFPQLRQM